MKKDKYYRTSDLNLATFLFAKLKNIPDIQWVGDEKKEFAFEKTELLQSLIQAYMFGGPSDKRLLVNAKFLLSARVQLLDKLKRD